MQMATPFNEHIDLTRGLNSIPSPWIQDTCFSFRLASHPLNWLAVLFLTSTDSFVSLPPCGGCDAAHPSFHAVRVQSNKIRRFIGNAADRIARVNERRQFTRNTASTND